jgi:hypothetical protein
VSLWEEGERDASGFIDERPSAEVRGSCNWRVVEENPEALVSTFIVAMPYIPTVLTASTLRFAVSTRLRSGPKFATRRPHFGDLRRPGSRRMEKERVSHG